MEKQKSPGGEFIDAVCAKVRFTPAREKIAEELQAHIEDRAAMLTEHGVAPESAAARAVAAMGDPAEIGAALDREHSPFWGWMAIWTDIARYLVLFLVGLMVLFILMGEDLPTPMRPMAVHDCGGQAAPVGCEWAGHETGEEGEAL